MQNTLITPQPPQRLWGSIYRDCLRDGFLIISKGLEDVIRGVLLHFPLSRPMTTSPIFQDSGEGSLRDASSGPQSNPLPGVLL